ncbi:MAG: hypothetical protein E7164_01250 [Firmicutes bacterium]|nr:hypothetical protein [Bacillota bacterium]
MKKETLLEIIMGTIGGLTFAIGMCMCLIPEWNLFAAGVVIAIIGFILLLCIIPIYRKDHPKKVRDKKIDLGLTLTWIIGVVGSLIMGFGMSKIMVDSPEKMDMIIGMITGVVGLLICVLNYPVYSYLKSNKN